VFPLARQISKVVTFVIRLKYTFLIAVALKYFHGSTKLDVVFCELFNENCEKISQAGREKEFNFVSVRDIGN
jgi:hypothetical protein